MDLQNALTGYPQTALDPATMQLFQGWLKGSGAPYEDAGYTYDMPGFFQAMLQGQFKPWMGGHFPDVFKTPYHPSFSNESKYAMPTAPHWVGNQLINQQGNVVFDEALRGLY